MKISGVPYGYRAVVLASPHENERFVEVGRSNIADVNGDCEVALPGPVPRYLQIIFELNGRAQPQMVIPSVTLTE